MFKVQKMLKDKRLLSMVDTTDSTRDGELLILTDILVKEAKVSIKSTDSTSIEHSSSDQECQ
jgi:hypothetical protein